MAYSRPGVPQSSSFDMNRMIEDKYFSSNSPTKQVKVSKTPLQKKRELVIPKNTGLKTREDILNQLDERFFKREQELLAELSNVLKKLYIFYMDKQREMRTKRSELEDPLRYKKMITNRVSIVNKLAMLLKELYRK